MATATRRERPAGTPQLQLRAAAGGLVSGGSPPPPCKARPPDLAACLTATRCAQLLAAEKLGDGTHRWKLEQGYEMGRPSDLWLEADVAGAKLVAVRVAGQAVQISSGVLDI